jgi:oligoendopeptidase F
MTTTVDPVPRLPHWEVASFFPTLDSRELHAAHEGVTADLARLEALYDRHDVREGPPAAPTTADHRALADVLAATNELLEQVRLVSAYLYAHVSTDARDDAASGLQSQLQQELVPLTRLTKRFEAWVARFGADALTQGPDVTDVAAGHAFAIGKAAASAEHQMSEAEEGLAADLRLSGSSAWARLHRDLTARLTAEIDGAVLPMSVVRGMAHDPDAGVRRRAYDAELVAWEAAAVPLAAALNGAKGEAVVVNTRRGWTDALDPALFTNNVDRATLDAMTEAVVAALPDFRRFMLAKARLLGHDGGRGLPWWDQVAPVAARGGTAPTFDWAAATTHVREAFASFSPSLEALAARAIDDAWIDAEPRDGKVGGAFCLPVRGGESRVLLNFDGSFDSVQTLAHELGHAYHNTNLGERSPMQRQTPMALAETASIFCETIVVAAGLADADEAGRLVLLNTDLQGAAQVVVDIHSRFLFESELCRRRATRTLSIPELNELMLDAQRKAYGEGLDPDAMHPYMWAVKGHYFTPFYNWPYTFGLLFGIGLYARYLDDPDRFRQGYDDLLSSTGLGDAASLGARFDIDVRSAAFWSSSLDVLRGRIDDFVTIVDAESRR